MVKESCSRGIGCHGLNRMVFEKIHGAVKNTSTQMFKAMAMFLERHSGKSPSQHLKSPRFYFYRGWNRRPFIRKARVWIYGYTAVCYDQLFARLVYPMNSFDADVQ